MKGTWRARLQVCNVRIAWVCCVLTLVGVGCKRSTAVIGIAQYLKNPELDEARLGFLQEMERAGFTEGAGVSFDYQNGNGDIGSRSVRPPHLATETATSQKHSAGSFRSFSCPPRKRGAGTSFAARRHPPPWTEVGN